MSDVPAEEVAERQHQRRLSSQLAQSEQLRRLSEASSASRDNEFDRQVNAQAADAAVRSEQQRRMSEDAELRRAEAAERERNRVEAERRAQQEQQERVATEGTPQATERRTLAKSISENVIREGESEEFQVKWIQRNVQT